MYSNSVHFDKNIVLVLLRRQLLSFLLFFLIGPVIASLCLDFFVVTHIH